MSENSKIEWTDHTFNPWEGCQKVGPGCDHCYAETRNARFSGGQAVNWGPGAPRRRTGAANWRKPLAWNAAHFEFFAKHGRRQRVFCASLADVFDNEVDQKWRRDLFDIIELTPNLDWLLLTKRIGNVVRMLPSHDWAARGNVWLGATIVNQEEANRDIPKLLQVPARVRFLSMEPLLGPVNLTDVPMPESGHGYHEYSPIITGNSLERSQLCKPKIDWVIVGGESGPGARPMHPEWARSLRDQCQAAGVPFLFKQWGEFANSSAASLGDDAFNQAKSGGWVEMNGSYSGGEAANPVGQDARHVFRVGKKFSGRMLDGCTWNQFPEGGTSYDGPN
ncbi:MAG: hypothetical protein CML16_14940 [Pusillimonas sp.]|nr:hypothetical protein [Pusillimonas sp.]MBC42801.1 hypothetical protein [Pusillimonas sp.]HCP78610.1 hypothetical protein [Pusillimonas sp.]|tara:strand:+ start:599 stop:1603 length:1005 start_codon:yes stop_codon:yes gene_type:complete